MIKIAIDGPGGAGKSTVAKAVAKKLGIGVQSLSLIENGILPKRLSVCILYRIYKEFNITPSGIFSPTDE